MCSNKTLKTASGLEALLFLVHYERGKGVQYFTVILSLKSILFCDYSTLSILIEMGTWAGYEKSCYEHYSAGPFQKGFHLVCVSV